MKLSEFLNEDLAGKVSILLPRYIRAGKDEKYAKARLEELNSLDPTGNAEYLPWLAKIDLEGTAKMGKEFQDEDNDKIKNILSEFIKLKRKPNVEINRDINSYKDYSDLAKTLAPWKQKKPEEIESKKGLKKIREVKGAKQIYNDGKYNITEISTQDAASKLLKYSIDPPSPEADGHWCVKDPRFSSQYLESGNLYLIKKDGVKYVLAHSRDIKDVYDRDLNSETMMEIIELFDKANLLDKIDYNWLAAAVKNGNVSMVKKLVALANKK